MAGTTTNLGLITQASSDYIDYTVFDANWQKLDQLYGNLQTKGSEVQFKSATLSGSNSIVIPAGDIIYVTMTGNVTGISLSNTTNDAAKFDIIFTGTYTLTGWPSSSGSTYYHYAGGTAPNISPALTANQYFMVNVKVMKDASNNTHWFISGGVTYSP